jgi:RNA polymerase sigma factor (TIGR02999 family)
VDRTDDRKESAASTQVVTRLLNEVGTGDSKAAEALLPLVYDQLRALAKRQMRRERSDQTLQATALVHEAYLRLVEPSGLQKWDGRWHFFSAAAEAMRRILVDRARRRSRLKHGGGRKRLALDDVPLLDDEPSQDLLALDEALAEFERLQPEKAQLVKLRYFAGLNMAEVAEALGISPATCARHWSYARAWLYARIKSTSGGV